MILARFGLAVPFFVNAVSYLGMVGVLLCWHPPQRGRHQAVRILALDEPRGLQSEQQTDEAANS